MTDWILRWQQGEIGWHRDQPNARLIEFMSCLKLTYAERVFVPLCGKSVDMYYLLEQGFKVLGVELSQLAIEAFFIENNLTYKVKKAGKFRVYSAPNIELYCGDYFDLDLSVLSNINAVYDRAALVALPADLRVKYVQHLYAIIPKGCRLLLLTLNYSQSQMLGPPFAVSKAEVAALYKGFEYNELECFDDIKNEPKFQRAGVDFIEKSTYCLRRH